MADTTEYLYKYFKSYLKHSSTKSLDLTITALKYTVTHGEPEYCKDYKLCSDCPAERYCVLFLNLLTEALSEKYERGDLKQTEIK